MMKEEVNLRLARKKRKRVPVAKSIEHHIKFNDVLKQLSQVDNADGNTGLDITTVRENKRTYRRNADIEQNAIVRCEMELDNERNIASEDERDSSKKPYLAFLRGRHRRYRLCTKQVVFGRNMADKIDIDFSEEGDISKVSRIQGVIKLKHDLNFYLSNIGKRTIFVNGKTIPTGKRRRLPDNSLIEIANLMFIFKVNTKLISIVKNQMTTLERRETKIREKRESMVGAPSINSIEIKGEKERE